MRHLIIALLFVSCATLPKVQPMTDCERSCMTSCSFEFKNNVGEQMMCEVECAQVKCEKLKS